MAALSSFFSTRALRVALGCCALALPGCPPGAPLEPKSEAPDQPTDVERLQSLELENRRLTDRLAEITAERDSLRAGRDPAPRDCPATPGAPEPGADALAVPAGPREEAPRVAIVVEGEEPGRVVEVTGEGLETPPPTPKKKSSK